MSDTKSVAEQRKDDILRKSSIVARRDTSMGVGIAAAGVLLICVFALLTWRTSYDGSVPAGRVVLSLAGVLAGVGVSTWAWPRYKQAVRDRREFLPSEDDEQDTAPANMAGSGLDPAAQSNPQVVRLCRVVYGIDESLVPVAEAFEFDGDNLVAYAFRSTTPGFFSTERSVSRVYESLNTVLGQGWNITPDPVTDTIAADKRSAVPSLAAPRMWRVVRSREEAAEYYPDFEVVSGYGADGDVSSKPRQVPHRLVVGATGGGKSVAVRAELMQYLAAGFRVFLADGKGTDYAPFFTFPNVSAISTTLPEHVILIHKVASILDTRRARSASASKSGDTSWRMSLTPVLLILDEFATVMTDLSTTYGGKNGGLDLIKGDIARILKVGREFRVHVIISTQGMQAKTLETDWLENIPMAHSLGKPSSMTINKAFPAEIQSTVERIGGTISRKTPGRALVTEVTESGVTAALYQSFWSYSPAETVGSHVPAELLPNWKEFKTRVSDAIVPMYPREWVEMVAPVGNKDYPTDLNWVDLSKFKVADLHALKPVLLQDPETLQPIPDAQVHDPLSESYLGTQPLDELGSTVIDI